MKTTVYRRLFLSISALLAAVIALLTQIQAPPAHALPTFARQTGTSCNTCHSIAPKLNLNGTAFQANYFNWPGGAPPKVGKGWNGVPISGLVTNTWQSSQNAPTGAQFQAFELFAAGGFRPYSGHGGGYWIDYLAGSNNGTRPGFLDGAWAAIPVAGSEGQLAVRLGQFSPINYQWDGVSNLMQTLPTALTDQVDNVALDASTPGVSLEYFSNRGKRTANGLYVDAGLAMGGHITLNKDSRLYSGHGVYVHAFERRGFNTRGLFMYRDGKYTQEGLIATRQLSRQLSVLGIAAVGGDINGNQQHLSAEADYVVNSSLAYSGRYEYISGVNSDQYPVADITWYPLNQHTLRLNAESVFDRGNRSNTLYALVQF